MKELVEVIAKSLVEFPEEVVVTEKQSGKTTVLELKVAPSDMGKVIGSTGRIAKSNPCCGESRCFQGRPESRCRYPAVTVKNLVKTGFFLYIRNLHQLRSSGQIQKTYFIIGGLFYEKGRKREFCCY